ncbi:apolipoprotein N-acyltransferase [Corallincola platygyrae]|uniref:Apolipoprotein N-acyltransferase n=1 Tax=Corallincola platygyrae TaxID=1193278 RepID=A0ABW4XQK3_9GAMM
MSEGVVSAPQQKASWQMLWQVLQRPSLAFAFGALSVLAFAPWSYWPIAIAGIAALYFLVKTSSPKQAFWLGYSFGMGLFAFGIAWVHISIDQFGGLPLPVSLFLMLLLAAYLSLFPALACWLTQKFKHHSIAINALLFAACWCLAESLRGYLLTGFPWLLLGYSQLDGVLAGWIPVIGIAGVSFFTALGAAVVSSSLTDRSYYWLLLPTLLAGVGVGLNSVTWTIPKGEPVDVVLVQGNIEQSMRWQPEQEWPTMLKYLDLTRPNYDADLIIWPEAAVPAVEPLAQEYLDNLNQVTSHNQTTLVSGIVDYNFDTKQFYNTLIVVGEQSKALHQYRYHNANRYQKHHLLPIGEFVPFGDILRPLAPLFNLPMSSFSRGSYLQENLVANEYLLAPAICYEIAFAEQLRRNVSNETDFLLTVSNDAWFGDSIGPQQHMEIARARAMELGRPLLRATNTGVTAVVDASGHELDRLAMFEADVLRLPVQRVDGMTPFAKVGHVPYWALVAFGFCLTLILIFRGRKAAD